MTARWWLTTSSDSRKRLKSQIDSLLALDESKSKDINEAEIVMTERLGALGRSVNDRIIVSHERQELMISARAAHEDLLEAIIPAIDDANFDLMMKAKSIANPAALGDLIESLRRLLEIEAESNLLAGSLTEASLVNESARLQPLRDIIGAIAPQGRGQSQGAHQFYVARKSVETLQATLRHRWRRRNPQPAGVRTEPATGCAGRICCNADGSRKAAKSGRRLG